MYSSFFIKKKLRCKNFQKKLLEGSAPLIKALGALKPPEIL